MRLFLLYSSILLTTISVTTTASSSGTPLDFRIGDTVELKVDDSNPENWKITLDYVYHGPSLDQLSYDVLLLDYATCTTAKTTTGPISPATPAISSSSDGSFTLNLDVDVWSLQQSENDFMVQTEATESTELTAFVEFCARVDLVSITRNGTSEECYLLLTILTSTVVSPFPLIEIR